MRERPGSALKIEISLPQRRLKPLDIEFMRKLHSKVNLVPVIAKSDTMTDDEIVAFKRRILDDIAYHNIRIFQPPVYDDDEETVQENEEILVGPPTHLTRDGADSPAAEQGPIRCRWRQHLCDCS